MLTEKLVQEHEKRFRERSANSGARFCQIVFLLLFNAALRFRIFGLTLGSESELPDGKSPAYRSRW